MINNSKNKAFNKLCEIIDNQIPGTIFVQGPSMSGKTEAINMFCNAYSQKNISVFTVETLTDIMVQHYKSHSSDVPFYMNEIFDDAQIIIVEDFDLMREKENTLLCLSECIKYHADKRFIFSGIELTERMSDFIKNNEKIVVINTESDIIGISN